jgi:hypothetical protein
MKSTEEHESDRAAQKEFANYYEFFSALQNVLQKWGSNYNDGREEDIPIKGVEEINWYQNILSTKKNQDLSKKLFKVMRVQTNDGEQTLTQVIENVSRRDDFALYAANKKAGRPSGSSGAPNIRHCFNRNKTYLLEIIKQYQNDLKALRFDYALENGVLQSRKTQGEDELSYSENQLKNKLDTLSEGDLINAIINHEKQGIKLNVLVNECKRRINDPSDHTFLATEEGLRPPKDNKRELYNCLYQLNDKGLRGEFLKIYLGEGMDLSQLMNSRLESPGYLLLIMDFDFIDGIDQNLFDTVDQLLKRWLDSGGVPVNSIQDIKDLISIRYLNEKTKIICIQRSVEAGNISSKRKDLRNLLNKFPQHRGMIIQSLKQVVIKSGGILKFIQLEEAELVINRAIKLDDLFNEIICALKDNINEIIEFRDTANFNNENSIYKFLYDLISRCNKSSFEIIMNFIQSRGFLRQYVQHNPKQRARDLDYYRSFILKIYRIYRGERPPEVVISVIRMSNFTLFSSAFGLVLPLLSPDHDLDWLNENIVARSHPRQQNYKSYDHDYVGELLALEVLPRFGSSVAVAAFIREISERPPRLSNHSSDNPYLNTFGCYKMVEEGNIWPMPLLIARGLKLADTSAEREEVMKYFSKYFESKIKDNDYDLLFENLDPELVLFIFMKMEMTKSPLKRYKKMDFLDFSKELAKKMNYTTEQHYDLLKKTGLVKISFGSEKYFPKLVETFHDMKEVIYKDLLSGESSPLKTRGNANEISHEPRIRMSSFITQYPNHLEEILDARDYARQDRTDEELTLLIELLKSSKLDVPVFLNLSKKLPIEKLIPNLKILVFFLVNLNKLSPAVSLISKDFLRQVDRIAGLDDMFYFNQTFSLLKSSLSDSFDKDEFLYGDFLKILEVLRPFFSKRVFNFGASTKFNNTDSNNGRPLETIRRPGRNLTVFVNGLPKNVSSLVFGFYKDILLGFDGNSLFNLLTEVEHPFRVSMYEMMSENFYWTRLDYKFHELAGIFNMFAQDRQEKLMEMVLPCLLSIEPYPQKLVVNYHDTFRFDAAKLRDLLDAKVNLTNKIMRLFHPDFPHLKFFHELCSITLSNLMVGYERSRHDPHHYHVRLSREMPYPLNTRVDSYELSALRLSPGIYDCWKLACIGNEEERVQAILQAIRQHRPASTKATLLLSRAQTRERMEQELEQKVRDLVKPNP